MPLSGRTTKTGSSWTNALVALLLVAASAALALGLGEAALRLVGFSYPAFHQLDDLTGTRLRARTEGWHRSEGEAYIRINSRGLRDREHALEKAPGVYRIAVLGDSYAEALQVPLEKTFWWLLAEKLERCGFAGGKRIEPVNFGVSGYGTAQELLTLRHRAWQYAPDMVLVAFFPGNDVRNNSKVLEKERNRPFFVLRDGRLVLDDSFAASPGYREDKSIGERRAWLYELRLYQLVRRVRAGEITVRHNAPIAAALASGATGVPSLSESGLDDNALREPPDRAWSDAWTVTEKLLVAMHQEARARDARFVVAVLSSAGAVYPDPEFRKRYSGYLGVADLFYPERRIGRLGKQEGFQVVALAPELQHRADATRTAMHGFANAKPGFGHWNEEGHRVAGDVLARRLCAE
jgi:lysophospholipase L1-like esterase